MNSKTYIFHSLLVAAIAVIGTVDSADCFSQIAFRSRRGHPPASVKVRAAYGGLGASHPSFGPLSYRHRPTLKSALAPGLNFNSRVNNFGINYYQLPYYWGAYRPDLGQSVVASSKYPSNITAYDSEFRKSPTPAVAAEPNSQPQPQTVINRYVESSSQKTVSSRFELQQRLFESNQIPAIKSVAAASNLQGHAEKAFHEGRYSDAAYYSDRATEADPHNGLIHLFASQAHFAIGKYSVATLMLEKATNMLSESQWDYIVRNYDSFYGRDDYVAQTRELANYVRRRPDDNRARTLLGYHYGSLGYKTTASKLFHQSLQTFRNDEFAQRLLPIFGDSNFSSTVESQVQAPTPDLLDEPVLGQTEHYSASGKRLIFLSPTQETGVPIMTPPKFSSPVLTAPREVIEELPPPEEMFFESPDLPAPEFEIEIEGSESILER